jgi:hypothetical protein
MAKKEDKEQIFGVEDSIPQPDVELSELQPRDLEPGEMLEEGETPAGLESRPLAPSELGEGWEPEPDRNIIYVGDGEPATEYHGAFKVSLPHAETQKRGFYHEQARQIIQQFPKKYKRFVQKGDK